MTIRHAAFALAANLGLAAQPAAVPAAEYFYPSAGYATLQEAVDDAAANGGALNTLNLGPAPIATAHEVVIGGEFNADRQLVIRPDPALAGLTRTAVVSSGGTEPIFRMTHCTDVTLQDLDILRNSTNANHLVTLDTVERVTVERCRIGSTWSSVGAANMFNLQILYPTQVVVRNCILFSRTPGNFAKGINADGFTDPANSLFLYNNVVADYLTYGIHLHCNFPGVTLVLRNNVVLNHPGAPSEPTAYRSGVTDIVNVYTDGNTAFASVGHVESLEVGAESSIAGSSPGLRRLNRPDVGPAFVSWAWNATPAWHPNPNFFRLVDFGPLHLGGSVRGVDVSDGSPDADDIAVTDDIEHDVRPGGSPSHTDRGADQIEDGALTAAPQPAPPAGALRVAAGSDPARGQVAFRAQKAGQLVAELFDLAGRRVWRAQRHVSAGEEDQLAWPRGHASGVLLYRLTLTAEDGSRERASGKVTLAR